MAINIRLLVAVYQAQKRHKQITGDTSPVSLLDLPVLKSVGAIILVFAFCHTGGLGMYITDVIRAFYSQALNTLTGNVAVFLDETSATHALLFRYTAYFLLAVNSSINVILYCLYLPTFRQYWKKLFDLGASRWFVCRKEKRELPTIFPLDEVPGLYIHQPSDDTTDNQYSVQVWSNF